MNTANKILMTITGLVLLVAAALKVHHLLTEPIISQSFWRSWEFFLLQIPLEIGLGIWLISGLFRKAAWLIAVISFGGFIIVTLRLGLIGAASCGCFGTVHVNPWVTLFTIDVPLFVGLLIFRPKGYKLLPPPWPKPTHFFGVAIPTFILLAIIVPVLILNRPPEKTAHYEVVKPEEWTNKDWPLLTYIDIADSLRPGIAIILLYHYDCPQCLEAIPIYDQMSRQLAGNQQAIRVAFIEVPPYVPEQESPIPKDTPAFIGKLAATKKWYISTPLVLVTLDGVVVKFWQDQIPPLEEILETIFTN